MIPAPVANAEDAHAFSMDDPGNHCILGIPTQCESVYC